MGRREGRVREGRVSKEGELGVRGSNWVDGSGERRWEPGRRRRVARSIFAFNNLQSIYTDFIFSGWTIKALKRKPNICIVSSFSSSRIIWLVDFVLA